MADMFSQFSNPNLEVDFPQAASTGSGGGRVYYGDYSFNTGKIKKFSNLDYFVFVSVLVISVIIAVYQVWKERSSFSLDEYLLAGRSMGPVPVALSLLGSFISTITLLGAPAEMYNYTTIYWWICLGYFFTMAAAAHIYMPMFYQLQVTSVFEYLEKRFSRGLRTIAACAYYVQMIFFLGIVLLAPSLALCEVTGVSVWGTVISLGVTSTLYTAMGGMRTVLWTDVFQTSLMIVGVVVTLIKVSTVVGGLGVAWEVAERTNRLQFADFRLDPRIRHTVWSLVIGGSWAWLFLYGVNQAQVQRMLTCPTMGIARVAIWFNVLGLSFMLLMSSFNGLLMAAFYENCDPLKTKFAKNVNQLLPLLAMDTMSDIPGLRGIFLAGLQGATLSSVSSALNAMTATILEDIVKIYIITDMSDQFATYTSQVITLLVGVVAIILTVAFANLEGLLERSLTVIGMIGGPLLGLFSMGFFFPWANVWGAYSGFIVSFFLLLWIGLGHATVPTHQSNVLRSTDYCNRSAFDNATLKALDTPAPPAPEIASDFLSSLYGISYLWFTVLAVFVCLTLGLIVSFSTGPIKPESLDPRLICPLCDFVFPFYYLPEHIRRPLRFGINHEGKYDKAEIFNHQYVTIDRPLETVDEIEEPSTTEPSVLILEHRVYSDEYSSSASGKGSAKTRKDKDSQSSSIKGRRRESGV